MATFTVLFCNNLCKWADWFILELIHYKQPRHKLNIQDSPSLGNNTGDTFGK